MSRNEPLVAVLAAGASARFGGDKLLAQVAGRPLLAWTLRFVLATVDVSDVCVVVRPCDARRAALAREHAPGIEIVPAPLAAHGLRHSVDAACAHALQTSASGIVLLLCDDPLAARELPTVRGHVRERPQEVTAIRRSCGTPHPVYVPRSALPELAVSQGPGDHDPAAQVGLRALVGGSSTRWLQPAFAASSFDVDEPTHVSELEDLLGAG